MTFRGPRGSEMGPFLLPLFFIYYLRSFDQSTKKSKFFEKILLQAKFLQFSYYAFVFFVGFVSRDRIPHWNKVRAPTLAASSALRFLALFWDPDS